MVTASSSAPAQVVIHPLVLLSVVDHYNRAARNTKKRVVGVLLGQYNKDKVNVANSYAVPFEEDEKDPSVWFLDHNYHEAMYEMFKKVNAKEKMIGWYHSGPKLRASDLEINELFKRYTPNPVLVIIDVQPKALGLPTDAYFSVEDVHDDGTATTKTFHHIPSLIEAEESEEIGVEHLLRDIKDNAQGTLSTKITNQLNSLKGLETRLTEIKDYLEKVKNGLLPINHQIIYNLQDIFNLLPNLNIPAFAKSFSIKTNDELLVIYVCSLIRAVIAMHNLIENKIVNRDAEKKLDEKEEKALNAPAADVVETVKALNFNPSESKPYQVTLSHFQIPHLEASDYRSAYHQLCDWLYGWNVSDGLNDEDGDLLKSKRVPRNIDLSNDIELVECERIMASFQTLFYFSQRQLHKYYSSIEIKLPRVGGGYNTIENSSNAPLDRRGSNLYDAELDSGDLDNEMDRVWATKKNEQSDKKNDEDDGHSVKSNESLDLAVEMLLKNSNKGYVVKAAVVRAEDEVIKNSPSRKDSMEVVIPPDIVVVEEVNEDSSNATDNINDTAVITSTLLFNDAITNLNTSNNEPSTSTSDVDDIEVVKKVKEEMASSNSIESLEKVKQDNGSNEVSDFIEENLNQNKSDGDEEKLKKIPDIDEKFQESVTGDRTDFLPTISQSTLVPPLTNTLNASDTASAIPNSSITMLQNAVQPPFSFMKPGSSLKNLHQQQQFNSQEKSFQTQENLKKDINSLFNEIDRSCDYTLLCMVNLLVILTYSELLDHKEIYQKQLQTCHQLAADFISNTLKSVWDLLNKEFDNDVQFSEVRDLNAFKLRLKQMIQSRAFPKSQSVNNNTRDAEVNKKVKYRFSKLHKKFELLHILFTSVDIHLFPRFVEANKDGCKSAAYSEFDSALWLTGGYDGIIRIHDLRPGIVTGVDVAPLAQFVGHRSIVSDVHFTKKDSHIVSCSFDRTIKIWSAQTGTCEKTLTGHTDSVTTCHLTKDGRYIASGSIDCTVRFWDMLNGECISVIKKHSRWVKIVRFSADGRYLASAGLDRRIYIWDVKLLTNAKTISHTRCIESHTDSVLDMAMSKPGILITCSRDSTVRVYDFINGHEWHCINLSPSWACSVTISECGEYFATGAFDNSINIFKTKSGDHIRHLRVFNFGILCVRFPKDLEYIVVGGNEGFLQQIYL
ncbi:proteasome regulatory particle subunit [Lobulomyces angularis]|nr:proteasome regulatory particle subunit [Lobulomyces angularis]